MKKPILWGRVGVVWGWTLLSCKAKGIKVNLLMIVLRMFCRVTSFYDIMYDFLLIAW